MSTEQFYGQVLRVYPRWWRRERGEEVLGVLMESGGRPSAGETAALVRHGLALRVLGGPEPGAWREPLAVSAVLMAALMGVWGFLVCLGSAYAAYLLAFHPDPYSTPYVEPLWVVGACWVVALGCVLLRLGWAAAVAAWAGVGLHAAVLAGAFGLDGSLSWPYSDFTGDVAQLERIGPTVGLAVLLSWPGRAAQGVDLLGRRRLLRGIGLLVGAVVLFGLVGLVVYPATTLAGLAIYLGVLALPVELYRRHMLMRGAVAMGFWFAWYLLVPLADGSGSRLPHSEVGLGVSLGLIPLLVLPVVLLAIRNVASGGVLQRALVTLTESLADHARLTGPGRE